MPSVLASSATVDDEVPGHAEQPRSCGRGGKHVGMPPRPQQRLLDDVLRCQRVAADLREHIREQRGTVLAVQAAYEHLFAGR